MVEMRENALHITPTAVFISARRPQIPNRHSFAQNTPENQIYGNSGTLCKNLIYDRKGVSFTDKCAKSGKTITRKIKKPKVFLHSKHISVRIVATVSTVLLAKVPTFAIEDIIP